MTADHGTTNSLTAALIATFYDAEVSGEVAFGQIAEHVTDDYQRRVCRLLEEVEAATAFALISLIRRYGVAHDDDLARRRGQAWATGYANSTDWLGFWKAFSPVTEAWLGGMKFLQAVCDEDDRQAVAQLVEHEEALLEFAQREINGAPDAFVPLERYLERAASGQ